MVGSGTFRLEPPRLRTTEDLRSERHATWFELFFDLVFAAAVVELATALADDPTSAVFGRFAGLFLAISWAWTGFTVYANRFDTDDLIYRLIKAGAAFATAAIAIEIPRVMAGEGGPSSSRSATPWCGCCWSPSTCVPGSTFAKRAGG